MKQNLAQGSYIYVNKHGVWKIAALCFIPLCWHTKVFDQVTYIALHLDINYAYWCVIGFLWVSDLMERGSSLICTQGDEQPVAITLFWIINGEDTGYKPFNPL